MAKDVNKVSFEGAADFKARLQGLTPKLALQVERKSIKKACQTVMDAAVSRTPVGETGNLAEGWKIQVSKKPWGVKATVKNTAPHAHLVELGHLMVSHSGKITGRVPEHPFLRPALWENQESALKTLSDGLNEALSKAEKKSAK